MKFPDIQGLQGRIGKWARKNFGGNDINPPYRTLLGAVEELGELCHAHLKQEQGIREDDYECMAQDAVGDVFFYLLDYCERRGWNISAILEAVESEVLSRDWSKYPKNGKTE